MNKIFALILMIISFVFACRQDSIQSIPSDDFEKFSKLIETNAVIVIRDELGSKLQGVYLTLEGRTYVSDANGLIMINRVALKNTGTLVYLTHPNYFRTPKRIYPTSSVINLTILSKNPAKKFLSNTDSQIEFDQVNYEFDANTIADEKGNLYTGEVFIYSSIISPIDPQFGLIMPSDFRAYNNNGKSVLINSLGIVATELFTNNGDPLYIKKDASVKVSLKIDQAIKDLPASISTWSISEDKNTFVWREENIATKINQEFIFYADHFSFWNIGQANNYVKLEGKVTYTSKPIQNVFLIIKNKNSLIVACTKTNPDGQYEVLIPKDENLYIEFYSTCNERLLDKIYEEKGLGFTLDSNKDFVLNIVTNINKIYSGKVISCEANDINSTVVQVNSRSIRNYFSFNKNGEFNIILPCFMASDFIGFQAWDF